MPPSNKHELLLGDAITNAAIARVLREVADCLLDHFERRQLKERAAELDAQKMPGVLDIPGVKDYVNATQPSLDPRLLSAPSQEGAGGSGQAAGLYKLPDGNFIHAGERCRVCSADGRQCQLRANHTHGHWNSGPFRAPEPGTDRTHQDSDSMQPAAPSTNAALDETPPVQFKTCPNCKAYTDLSAHACRREGGVCTISDIDEARGAAGPEVECKHGPWLDALRRMYASACYDGVGQDFLTILSHIRQQAERIAELERRNGSLDRDNQRLHDHAVEIEREYTGPLRAERDALRARVAELEQYKAWAEPQIARPVEAGVVEENNALRAENERLRKDIRATEAGPAAGLCTRCGGKDGQHSPLCMRAAGLPTCQHDMLAGNDTMHIDYDSEHNYVKIKCTVCANSFNTHLERTAPATDAALDEAMGWLNALASPHNILLEVRKKAAIILSHIRQQAERIAELEQQGEVDSCVKIDLDYYRGEANRFKDERDALRAENERLVKFERRSNWWRDWYMRGEARSEIDPLGHIRTLPAHEIDRCVDYNASAPKDAP